MDSSGYAYKGKDIEAERLARTTVGRFLFRYVTPRFLVEKNVKQAYTNPNIVTHALVDRYYDMMRRAGNRDTFIKLCNVPLEDLSAHIQAIRVPTLILWGRKDVTIPVEYAEKFNRDIAGSKLIYYEGVGHVPQQEIPEQSAKDAALFLAEK